MGTRTPEEAIAFARNQSSNGPKYGTGECLWRVHDAYGVPTDGTPNAAAYWKKSQHKHLQTDPHRIPRGAPVWWTGGSSGYGHVAISAGDGMCWSTDIKRPGYFDRVRIERIHDQWGLTLVGWTNDIDSVVVFQPKPVITHPMKARPLLNAGVNSLQQGIAELNLTARGRTRVHQVADDITAALNAIQKAISRLPRQ